MARPADPQRRDDILNAAREVFLERGFTEARLSDIAQHAGIVPSTLYLYFDSKEDMVRALADNVRQRVTQAILPILEHLRGRDDIVQLVQTLLTPVSEAPDMFRLAMLDTGLSSLRLYPSRSPRGPIYQEVLHALEVQMEQGFIRRYDPAALVDMLLVFLRRIVELYAVLEETEKQRYKETFVQVLCNMLLP